MSEGLVRLVMRFQKMFAPTVHVLIPKVLFTYMLAQILREKGEPREENRELFRQGIWAGNLSMSKLASPAQLRRFRPSAEDLERTRRGVELYGAVAWYIFAGHLPSIRTEVADREGVVWIEIREDPERDAFYKIVAPEGVNPLFFVAGAYEGAASTAFRMIGVEDEWFCMWRPLGAGGICGFYAPKSAEPRRVAEIAGSRCKDFFDTVSWSDSAAYLDEMLGFKVPPPA